MLAGMVLGSGFIHLQKFDLKRALATLVADVLRLSTQYR
jgi:hypothetical protein